MRKTYELKLKENRANIIQVKGNTPAEAITKLADKCYGGLGEMIANELANSWKQQLSVEAIRNAIQGKTPKQESKESENTGEGVGI
jgi:hypothetical protein